jgi:hypothetical protein
MPSVAKSHNACNYTLDFVQLVPTWNGFGGGASVRVMGQRCKQVVASTTVAGGIELKRKSKEIKFRGLEHTLKEAATVQVEA